MSLLYPEYAENIIVAVIVNKILYWYITEKEIWYMDYYKRIKAFTDRGYVINENHIEESRRDLLMLDTNNIKTLQKRISEFKVNTVELRKMLEEEREINKECFYDFSPSLYIDFDKKIFYSCYRETTFYEDYVPDGWTSKFKDFLDDVPNIYRYWINDKNISYFKEEE